MTTIYSPGQIVITQVTLSFLLLYLVDQGERSLNVLIPSHVTQFKSWYKANKDIQFIYMLYIHEVHIL